MLEPIALPGTGRATTRLGFGCSGLMGGISEKESLLLLETAFDAGIRHFDVAPSYGYGMAERCVGKFLRGKTDQVTITTKYGIHAPPRVAWLDLVRSAVRPLIKRLPALRQRAAQAAAGLKAKAHFSAMEARQSLDHSFRELGVERIDLWLLHEATSEELDGSDLLPLLQQIQRAGKIGMYGVGGERGRSQMLWQRNREYCPVMQVEWCVLDNPVDDSEAFRIYHRAISGALAKFRYHFEQDATLCRRWSDAVDADLSKPEILAALLLQAALTAHPGSIVLFSSRRRSNIRSNLRALDDVSSALRAQHFLQLIASERSNFASFR